MKKKIISIAIILIILLLMGAAAFWLKSSFTKEPTLRVTSSGILEAGGLEE